MDRALAKELMDAGFHSGSGENYTEKGLYGAWLYPTLEELIDALGPGRFVLDHLEDGRWEAMHVRTTPMNHFGVTAIEAVARLWLSPITDASSNKPYFQERK
jgi:hypothetical protein